MEGIAVQEANGDMLSGLKPRLVLGKTFEIYSKNLSPGTTYTVHIPAGSLAYDEGPSEEITWSFTTASMAPVVKKLAPADGSSKVATNVKVAVTFDSTVKKEP